MYKQWGIQIQPMLRLNTNDIDDYIHTLSHSNTTNVKVKLSIEQLATAMAINSNTTNVKVKL